VTEHNSSPHSANTEQRPSTVPREISSDQIIGILAECEGAGLPETIDDETLLVLDSYAAIWIQHLLEERHGVVVRLSGEAAGIDSVSGLRELVNRGLRAADE
jgi:hypothetical protein